MERRQESETISSLAWTERLVKDELTDLNTVDRSNTFGTKEERLAAGKAARASLHPEGARPFTASEWSKCADAIASDDISLADMGCQWRRLCLVQPGQLGIFMRDFSEYVVPIRGAGGRRLRDLLPLPLPKISLETEWETRRSDRSWRRHKRREWVQLCRSYAREVWLWLTIAL